MSSKTIMEIVGAAAALIVAVVGAVMEGKDN